MLLDEPNDRRYRVALEQLRLDVRESGRLEPRPFRLERRARLGPGAVLPLLGGHGDPETAGDECDDPDERQSGAREPGEVGGVLERMVRFGRAVERDDDRAGRHATGERRHVDRGCRAGVRARPSANSKVGRTEYRP